MPAPDVRAMASCLEAYQNQLVALGEALGALRLVSDSMIASLARDRAALASYLDRSETDEATVGAAHASSALAEIAARQAAIAAASSWAMKAPSHHDNLPPAASSPLAGPGDGGDQIAASDMPVDAPGECEPMLASVEGAVAQASQEVAVATGAEPIISLGTETEIPAPQLSRPRIRLASSFVSTGLGEQPSRESAFAVPRMEAGSDILRVPGPDVASNVIVLEPVRAIRSAPPTSSWRRYIAVAAACLAVGMSAGWGMYGLLRGDIGVRLIELRACSSGAATANNDCALLAWLPL